jgi:branched-chain amino acid transport system substrate-binding protein
MTTHAPRLAIGALAAATIIGLMTACSSSSNTPSGGSGNTGADTGAASSIAASGNPGSGTVTIGDSNPYTGPSASYGKLIDDGFLLGVADHQSGAPQIKLDKQDDACTPDKAVGVIQQFISSGSVQAMLGPGCSGAMAATQKVMAKAQLVHSSGSYQPSLTEVGDNYYFRTVPNDTELNTALAKYIASKGYKSIAVVNDDTSYGTGGAQVLIDQVQKLGVKVVYHGKFTYGATDFSGQVVRLRDANADAFFFDGYEGELGVLVKQTRQLGLSQPIFGPTAMGNPEFLDPAGSAANGVTYISNYNRGNPKTMAFTKDYQSKFGITPTDVAASSYLVGVTYAEAFKVAGASARGDALAKAIRGLNVSTPLGTISYDDKGDLKSPPIIIGTIENGQPKVVEDLSNNG